MQDDIPSLYAYNRWADAKILEACRTLSPEQYDAEPVPGWSSVRSTINHIAIVTDGWLRGFLEDHVANFASEAELMTVDDASRLLDRAHDSFAAIAPSFTPEWLATPRTFRGGNRSAVLAPWVVLRHLVNHATYHRGQVASKLKRLGVEPPMTDLVFWAFEQKPQKM